VSPICPITGTPARTIRWTTSAYSAPPSSFTLSAPPDALRYVVEKGSVAVDGISLTVAALGDDAFDVAVIPHTLAVTTLGHKDLGAAVNLEADLIAKYVERLLVPTSREGN